VTDAREVVKTGDIVKVRVVEVDVARKRIGLTMKLGEAAPQRGAPGENRFQGPAAGQRSRAAAEPQSTAMASAFAKLRR